MLLKEKEMLKGIKIDNETKERIIKRLKQPGSCVEIAREFGYASSWMTTMLHRLIEEGELDEKYRRVKGPFGAMKREIKLNEERIIEKLKQQGNLTKIAKKYNISRYTLTRIMHKALLDGRLDWRYKRGIHGTYPKQRQEQEGRLIKRLESPGSLRDIAKELGCEFNTLSKIMNKLILEGKLDEKYRRDNTGKTQGEKQKVEERIIERLRKPGSLAQIAKELHENTKFITSIFNKAILDGRLDEGYRRDARGKMILDKELHETRIIERLKKPGTCVDIATEFGYKSSFTIIRIMHKAIKDGRLHEKYRRVHTHIINNKDLLRKAMQEFIDIYDEYKLSSKYTLNNFLSKWDSETKRFKGYSEAGRYLFLVNGIKYMTKTQKQKDYLPILLDLIGKPDDKLRIQIEDIISGERYRREARESLERAVEEYVA